MKILQVGDIHLEDKALTEIEPYLATVLGTARTEVPDLIASTGDIFNAQGIPLQEDSTRVAFDFFRALAGIAPVVGCLGTPSHDGRGPMNLNAIEGVTIFDRPAVHFLEDPLGIRGPLLVSVLPAMDKRYWQQHAGDMGIEESDRAIGMALSAILADFGLEADKHPDAPHVLIGHYTVGGAYISESQELTGRDIEVSRQQLELARAILICFGHIHYRQQICENIFFNGSSYQKDYGEMDPKGFWIHEIEKIPMDPNWYLTKSTPVDTPSRRLVKASIDCAEAEDGDPEKIIEYLGEDGDYDGGVVRVEIKAWSDEADLVDREKIEAHLKALGAKSVDIRVSRIPRANVRSKEIVNAVDLRTKLTVWAEMNGTPIDEETLELADWLDSEDPEAIIDTVAETRGSSDEAGEEQAA